MNEKSCVLCGRMRSLFSLRMPPEEEGGEEWEVKVCGTCWDVAARIAQLAVDQKLKDLETRILALEGASAVSARGKFLVMNEIADHTHRLVEGDVEEESEDDGD